MMSRSRLLVAVLLMVAAAPACAPTAPSGMRLSAPVAMDPSSDPTHASFVVAFPESPCGTGDSAVFLDADGRFVGAVAPGTAAVLTYPLKSPIMYAVMSSDITASLGNPLIRNEMTPRDGAGGVVVVVDSVAPHSCRFRLTVPQVTSLRNAQAAAAGLQWLSPHPAVGNAWLEENRPRVEEILGRDPNSRLTVTSRLW